MYILLTSGFHRLIAHSFLHFETKIHICDVIVLFVTSENACGVNSQLSATQMNYRKAVHYSVLDELGDNLKLCCIGFDGSSRYFCRVYMKCCQVNHASLVLLYFLAVQLLRYRCLYSALFVTIQAKTSLVRTFNFAW